MSVGANAVVNEKFSAGPEGADAPARKRQEAAAGSLVNV